MEFEIYPYLGVGSIRFGMSPQDVRRVIGEPYSSFLKSPDSLLPTDSFDGEGVHVYYKAPGQVEAIEMAHPSAVVWQGTNLIGQKFEDVRRWIELVDPEAVIDDSGLTSYKLGFGVFAPGSGKDPSLRVESVIIFREGYYD